MKEECVQWHAVHEENVQNLARVITDMIHHLHLPIAPPSLKPYPDIPNTSSVDSLLFSSLQQLTSPRNLENHVPPPLRGIQTAVLNPPPPQQFDPSQTFSLTNLTLSESNASNASAELLDFGRNLQASVSSTSGSISLEWLTLMFPSLCTKIKLRQADLEYKEVSGLSEGDERLRLERYSSRLTSATQLKPLSGLVKAFFHTIRLRPHLITRELEDRLCSQYDQETELNRNVIESLSRIETITDIRKLLIACKERKLRSLDAKIQGLDTLLQVYHTRLDRLNSSRTHSIHLQAQGGVPGRARMGPSTALSLEDGTLGSDPDHIKLKIAKTQQELETLIHSFNTLSDVDERLFWTEILSYYDLRKNNGASSNNSDNSGRRPSPLLSPEQNNEFKVMDEKTFPHPNHNQNIPPPADMMTGSNVHNDPPWSTKEVVQTFSQYLAAGLPCPMISVAGRHKLLHSNIAAVRQAVYLGCWDLSTHIPTLMSRNVDQGPLTLRDLLSNATYTTYGGATMTSSSATTTTTTTSSGSSEATTVDIMTAHGVYNNHHQPIPPPPTPGAASGNYYAPATLQKRPNPMPNMFVGGTLPVPPPPPSTANGYAKYPHGYEDNTNNPNILSCGGTTTTTSSSSGSSTEYSVHSSPPHNHRQHHPTMGSPLEGIHRLGGNIDVDWAECTPVGGTSSTSSSQYPYQNPSSSNMLLRKVSAPFIITSIGHLGTNTANLLNSMWDTSFSQHRVCSIFTNGGSSGAGGPAGAEQGLSSGQSSCGEFSSPGGSPSVPYTGPSGVCVSKIVSEASGTKLTSDASGTETLNRNVFVAHVQEIGTTTTSNAVHSHTERWFDQSSRLTLFGLATTDLCLICLNARHLMEQSPPAEGVIERVVFSLQKLIMNGHIAVKLLFVIVDAPPNEPNTSAYFPPGSSNRAKHQASADANESSDIILVKQLQCWVDTIAKRTSEKMRQLYDLDSHHQGFEEHRPEGPVTDVSKQIGYYLIHPNSWTQSVHLIHTPTTQEDTTDLSDRIHQHVSLCSNMRFLSVLEWINQCDAVYHCLSDFDNLWALQPLYNDITVLNDTLVLNQLLSEYLLNKFYKRDFPLLRYNLVSNLRMRMQSSMRVCDTFCVPNEHMDVWQQSCDHLSALMDSCEQLILTDYARICGYSNDDGVDQHGPITATNRREGAILGYITQVRNGCKSILMRDYVSTQERITRSESLRTTMEYIIRQPTAEDTTVRAVCEMYDNGCCSTAPSNIDSPKTEGRHPSSSSSSSSLSSMAGSGRSVSESVVREDRTFSHEALERLMVSMQTYHRTPLSTNGQAALAEALANSIVDLYVGELKTTLANTFLVEVMQCVQFLSTDLIQRVNTTPTAPPKAGGVSIPKQDSGSEVPSSPNNKVVKSVSSVATSNTVVHNGAGSVGEASIISSPGGNVPSLPRLAPGGNGEQNSFASDGYDLSVYLDAFNTHFEECCNLVKEDLTKQWKAKLKKFLRQTGMVMHQWVLSVRELDMQQIEGQPECTDAYRAIFASFFAFLSCNYERLRTAKKSLEGINVVNLNIPNPLESLESCVELDNSLALWANYSNPDLLLINNVEHFSERFLFHLEERVQSYRATRFSLDTRDLSAIKSTCRMDALGCQQSCPFCGSKCQSHCSTHATRHSCMQHNAIVTFNRSMDSNSTDDEDPSSALHYRCCQPVSYFDNEFIAVTTDQLNTKFPHYLHHYHNDWAIPPLPITAYALPAQPDEEWQKRIYLTGQWKGITCGGCLKCPTWRFNTQYTLTVTQSCEVKIVLIQRRDWGHRHRLDAIGFDVFRRSLSLQERGNQVRRIIELHEVRHMHSTGHHEDRSVSLVCKLDATDEPYVIIPSAVHPGVQRDFELCVEFPQHLMKHITFDEMRETAEWNVAKIEGLWDPADGSSGGSLQYRTWFANPQFLLNIKANNNNPSTAPNNDVSHSVISRQSNASVVTQSVPSRFIATLVLSLKNADTLPTGQLPQMGFYVFKTSQQKRVDFVTYQALSALVDLSKGSTEHSVRIPQPALNTLSADGFARYIVLPYTSEPLQHLLEFSLTTYSDCPVKMYGLQEHNHIYESSQQGHWTSKCFGGVHTSPAFHNNPKYQFVLQQKTDITVTLRQKHKDTPMLFYLVRGPVDANTLAARRSSNGQQPPQARFFHMPPSGPSKVMPSPPPPQSPQGGTVPANSTRDSKGGGGLPPSIIHQTTPYASYEISTNFVLPGGGAGANIPYWIVPVTMTNQRSGQDTVRPFEVTIRSDVKVDLTLIPQQQQQVAAPSSILSARTVRPQTQQQPTTQPQPVEQGKSTAPGMQSSTPATATVQQLGHQDVRTLSARQVIQPRQQQQQQHPATQQIRVPTSTSKSGSTGHHPNSTSGSSSSINGADLVLTSQRSTSSSNSAAAGSAIVRNGHPLAPRSTPPPPPPHSYEGTPSVSTEGTPSPSHSSPTSGAYTSSQSASPTSTITNSPPPPVTTRHLSSHPTTPTNQPVTGPTPLTAPPPPTPPTSTITDLIIHGEWAATCAGGCVNYPTFAYNPQYLVSNISNQGIDITVTLVQNALPPVTDVTTTQPQAVPPTRRNPKIPFYSMGIYVYTNTSNYRMITFKQAAKVASSGVFEATDSVSCGFKLAGQGSVMVIPCTFRPDEENQFKLILTPSVPNSLKCTTPQEWLCEVLRGSWSPKVHSGQPGGLSPWKAQRQYLLQMGVATHAVVLLDQVVPKTNDLHEISLYLAVPNIDNAHQKIETMRLPPGSASSSTCKQPTAATQINLTVPFDGQRGTSYVIVPCINHVDEGAQYVLRVFSDKSVVLSELLK